MENEVKLVPCPFCGQIPEMQPWHGGAPTKVLIGCVGLHPEAGFIDCAPAPSVTGETPDEAAAAWNDRVSPRPTIGTDEVVERVALECFQAGVDKWMDACFTPAIKADVQERCDRFVEESLEFVQAAGYSAERAHALVDYTFGRPTGEVNQEVGGVMVTLAAMCNTLSVDIGAAAETELARVWTKIDVIRAKQAAKPTGSALAAAMPTIDQDGGWQPIESAPRDGSYVLGFGPHDTRHSYMDVVHFFRGKWTIVWMDGYGEPTHWRPLPEPPAQPEGNQS